MYLDNKGGRRSSTPLARACGGRADPPLEIEEGPPINTKRESE